MKIYIDFSKEVITKTTSQTAYEGDFESIVFELFFFNYNNTNWYPTMSQLAPNGRKAGDFSADEAGTEIVEDGITYLKFEFTLGTGWVSIKGISNFFIWNNQFVNGTLTKKCIGKVTLQLNESTNGYFVFDPYLNPSVAAFMRELMEGVAHPAGVYTNSQIADLREDIGIVVSSTDGYWYYWDVTTNEYVQGAIYQAPFYNSSNKLNADLVDDTNSTHKFVTASEKEQIAANTTAIANRYTKAETNTLLGKKVNYIDFDNSADVTLSNYVYTITGETAEIIKSMNCIIKCLSTTFTFYLFADEFDMLLLPVNIENGQYIYKCMCNINGTNRVLYVPFYVENGVLHAKVFDARYAPDSNSPKDYVLVKTSDLAATGHKIELTLNNSNYQMTAVLKDANDNIISTSNIIDLPIESVVVNGTYDDTTKKVILTLQNGSTIEFSVADLISDLQSKITAQNKLSSDLVDDTNQNNKFVTDAEKTQITANANAIANTYTKTETLEQINVHKLINKTYAELALLKTQSNLVAGQMYRITDYVTKTNGKCNGIDGAARSLENPFDLIITANSVNTFSPAARAIHHTGDSYFSNSKLEAWKLWYCFDNDTSRFEWADVANGKGVIYRMIDEFGNDLPYDFKNIQFKRYKITSTSDQRHANAIGKYLGFDGNYNCVSDNTDYNWFFTFSKRSSASDNGSDLSLTQTLASSYQNCYYVKETKIGEYLTDTPNYRGLQALNNIVFECENIIVDVQIGIGSHHNTLIGNKDITYVYFKEMFRNNIIQGEMSHTRADECFEQNMIGDFLTYSIYATCWCKFTHHFSRNTAIHFENNDFEGQVSECKFPENFTRNHISNMWDNVNAETHDTFNCCEFGYMVNVTLSGLGNWDSIKTIRCYNVNIKIANFYGSNLGRMEYVNISEGLSNSYNISNLTIGAIYGSTSIPLAIALTDLYTHRLTTIYEKKIDFAYNTALETRCLFYRCAVYNSSYSIIDYEDLYGIIVANTGAVSWNAADSLSTKFADIADGLGNRMLKSNPTGTGNISMNSGSATGTNTFANGSGATASGTHSIAIGLGVTASGSNAVAIGGSATANNAMAHGTMAVASGQGAHALGQGAKAKGANQMVFGKFNISDTTSLEIVGNGGYYSENNARLLDSNGDEYLAGDVYVKTTFTKDSNNSLVGKVGTKLVPVTANPTLDGTEADLTGLEVNGVKYAVPQGSGGGGKSYEHIIEIGTSDLGSLTLTIPTTDNTPFTIDSLLVYLNSRGHNSTTTALSGVSGMSGTWNYIATGAYRAGTTTLGITYIYYANNGLSASGTTFPKSLITSFTDTVTEV